MIDKAALMVRLEKLKRARDTGVLIIRHGDSQTQFRSLDEINQIISDIEGKLHKRRRVRYAYQSDKGL